MGNKPKVVLDTNIFIRGWFSNDVYCNRVMDMIEQRKIQLLFSQQTIGELMYVTKYIGRNYYTNKADTIKDLETIAFLFYYSTNPNTTETVSPNINDSTDNIFLECAIEGNADFLVTNDFNSGMHSVNSVEFQILSAKNFVKIINSEAVV